jgi:lactoylglutathione lyase
MNVLHTAIWVSDLEVTAEFYRDGLGLEYSRDFSTAGVRNYFVAGGNGTEIQFKYDPERDLRVEPDGIDHLAVGVENLGATLDHLTGDRGSSVVKAPTKLEATGSTIAFVTDPDGYTIELIEKSETA